MKNKNIQYNNKKGQQKTLNVPNPQKVNKNREQLRKKLKDLLANQVISPPPKDTTKQLPRAGFLHNKGKGNKIISKDPSIPTKSKTTKQNGNKESLKERNPKIVQTKKSFNLEGGKKGGQNDQPKLKNLKKGKKLKANNDVSSKNNGTTLKRKLSNKNKPTEKGTKTPQPPKTKSEDRPQQLTNGKNKAKKSNQPPKKKTKKEAVPQTHPKSNKKKTKQQKYAQGRGPLRPPTPDSEIDGEMVSLDEPQIQSDPTAKTEHALVRARNEFEGSESENNNDFNSYLDFLFNRDANENSDDSTSFVDYDDDDDDDTEFDYSDEESDSVYDSDSGEYEDYSDDEAWEEVSSNGEDYFDTSDDDESYQPPEHIPEDVYIAPGTAVKYELSNNDVSFDSDSENAQIIELPPNNKEKEDVKPKPKQQESANETSKKSPEDSDDSCPDLVPIEESSYSESSYSHSCCSDCSCSSSDGSYESSSSKPKFEPMRCEIIDGTNAHEIDGIDDLFDAIGINKPPTEKKCFSIMDEIANSSINPKKVQIYTATNKMLDIESVLDSKETEENVLENSGMSELDLQNYVRMRVSKGTQTMENLQERECSSSRKTLLKSTQTGEDLQESECSSQQKTLFKSTQTREDLQEQSEKSESELECSPPQKTLPKKKETKEELSESTESFESNSDISSQKTVINKKTSTQEKTAPSTPKTPSLPKEKPSPTTKRTPQNPPKPLIRTIFFNAINCNHVIVLLKDPLYFYGTVKLKLLAGCVNLFGYNPKRNETLEIFSPRGYSFLKIEPSRSSGERALLDEKEILSLTPFFIRSDLEEIIDKFDHSKDAILILERNDRSKKVSMLRKYMVEHLFPNMNSIQSDRPFYTSEFLLRCIITPRTDTPLLINNEWNNIRVENNSKIMIIGGKSVGKSTLLRYLVNKNLNQYEKILLIDLDIGQPEIFVPQTMSATTLTEPLLGPGYLLTKQPDKSFLVGDISIMQSLQAYIDSLKALFDYCNGNSEYKDIPWIVNTMGYNKGFGDELISVICSLLQPSNIVQLESQKQINDFDVVMMKDNVKLIERNIIGGDVFEPSCEFDPQHQLTLIKGFIPPRSRNPNNEWNMKPREMRLAMILSRLSCILIGHAEWLTDVKPVCASIDDLHIIKMGDDQLKKEDLVKTLVGNLVYLCHMEPSSKAQECLGIGIVRGIDYPLRQIYLLPSIPHSLLETVNCLAICGIPLPSSILLNQGPKVKGTASYVYNTLDEASSMYIKHMINKPQPYFTGKRRNFVN